MSSLTSGLVSLIRAKAVDDEDLAAATLFVLDTVACVAGGRSTESGRILSEWSAAAGDDAGRAAFLASGLAHALEIDDLHKDSVTHPGCVVIPTAWFLAVDRGISGREFLTAVLHGYEAMARIGMAVGKGHYKLWHNTATCGPFGAAMAAARVLELGPREAVWALGNAGTQASGLWQFLPDGAMSKLLHTGRAAEAGYIAASLAARGFTGPDRILEGEQGFFRALCPDPNPDRVLAQPEAAWQLRRTSLKPWPCCRHTHPAIDAALELHTVLGDRRPTAVTVHCYRAALDVCNRPAPDTDYAAKFSLQHCVAAALTDGRVGFDSFGAQARARHAGLASRITLAGAAEVDARYPSHWGAIVDATLPDGSALTAARTDCKGDPELPLSASEVAAKAALVLGEGRIHGEEAARIVDGVLGLATARRIGDFPITLLEEMQ